MHEVLIVKEHDDAQAINFEAIYIEHQECGGEVKKIRNPATNLYSLHCACGLNIYFLDEQSAITSICQASITQNDVTLPKESFHSESCEYCTAICR